MCFKNIFRMKFYLLLPFLSFLLFSSCSKDTTLSQDEIDKQFNTDIALIEDYLKANNLVAEKTVQGVYYIIEVPGGDVKPKITNTVVTNYKGYYLDNVEFDSGKNIEFGLFQVVQGWQIGFPKFGKGGKGKLFIPSKYGYANNPPGSIRQNAVLVFDIELLDIK